MRSSNHKAVGTSTGATPSGVWYCRTHHDIVNEDEPHDVENEDRCGWADDDQEQFDCDWCELLIPAGDGA